jgi:hypothetical protein
MIVVTSHALRIRPNKSRQKKCPKKKKLKLTRVGFEPTPFRTRALIWRLRPLGHLVIVIQIHGLFYLTHFSIYKLTHLNLISVLWHNIHVQLYLSLYFWEDLFYYLLVSIIVTGEKIWPTNIGEAPLTGLCPIAAPYLGPAYNKRTSML